MSNCKHVNLVLLPGQKNRLRCKHCHLTIKAEDLGKNYCPECFEVHGDKRYDFEEVAEDASETTQYRCEDCGLIINGE